METKKIKLDRIDLNKGIQTRTCVTEDVAMEYAERMTEGDKFPPIVLFLDGEEPILVDGFHRVRASVLNGFTFIDAEVHTGDRKKAVEHALSMNMAHGLRRTNGDKRRAVMLAFKELEDKSDRWIAERCGVSNTFVSQLRPAEKAGELEAESKPKKRTGRDGVARAVKPKKEPKPKVKKAKPEEAAEMSFAPTPRMSDEERLMDLCNFIERQVKSLTGEIKDLPDAVLTELGQILASVDNVREAMGKTEDRRQRTEGRGQK